MNLPPRAMADEIASMGFGAEPLEKVFRLMALLEALNSHPFLKSRIALKGGTALNLFHFEVPRLSVDIDLNYLGTDDRKTMLAERPRVEQAIQAVCSREGLNIRRVPTEHAGGKWRLTYAASKGARGNLELDVNYLLRMPLWPCEMRDCHPVGSRRTSPVRLLDLHELAAGKLTALLGTPGLDNARLRLGFVVYGGINLKDWRTVSSADVKADVDVVQRELIPMLRADRAPARRDIAAWADRLVTECRERLSMVLPLNNRELEFLRRLNEEGEVAADLLTSDPIMQATVQAHPGLAWKALNVRTHHGRDDAGSLVGPR